MVVRIEPVQQTRRGRRRFVDLARRFRGGSPVYVPPLAGMAAAVLDPRKNPAFRYASQALWTARDASGACCGRIAATYDPRHAGNLGEKAGWFGFFDAGGDEAARALLDTAWRWLQERGAENMLGPADPDTNHECGCLIEGHDEMPYIMMPHHPPSYAGMFEAAGLVKARDLLAYESHVDRMPMERLRPVVERIMSRGKFRIRQIQRRNLDQLMEVALEVYNGAWQDNWGFLPMSAEEFAFEAHGLKSLLVPEMALVATRGDEPAGFILGVPDANPAIHAVNGRLLPFGILRLPFLLKKTGRNRVMALGVLPKFRSAGLETALMYEITLGARKAGYPRSELSWVLEDNEPMKKMAAVCRGRISRRYRIYRRP